MSRWTLVEIEPKWRIWTYREGWELRVDTPEGPAESDPPESDHKIKGTGEGIE